MTALPDPDVERAEASDVRTFWDHLEIPGLVDVHVHFLPEPVQAKVYEQFDNAGPKIGREWPIRYRGSHQERVELLRDFGVRRFPTLPYAHRPGIATYLNDWSCDFAATVPEVIRSATFFPEPEAATYVPDLVADGVEIFKVHVQVGEFDLNDPLLDEAWGALADAGTPVVVHAGSGPVGNAFTGPAPMARLLERFPSLAVVVAHMGGPEHEEFLELAERHEQVRLDTSMAFTDFFAPDGEFPRELLPRLKDLKDRVLLGSDFPTIPYAYGHQLEALTRLGLGDDWLRAVCWENGARLFRVEDTVRP